MGGPKPDGIWYNHFRKRADRRSFYIACAVSAAFHLSMVTVFSVVIYFPREDIRYFEFNIVPVSPDVAPYEVAAETSNDDDVDGPITTGPAPDQLALRGLEGRSGRPSIQLPTLEFAELERLRVREESFPSSSRYDEVFTPPADDSWARFSRGLSTVTRSLAQLRLSGGPDDGAGAPLALDGEEAPRSVHRPAEGFEAFVIWDSDPKDRALLFAPPIEALWSVDPGSVTRPIEVVMQVNALGRVVNVFSTDRRELVDSVQLTALQYRFAPLALEEGTVQSATLRIQRAAPERTP